MSPDVTLRYHAKGIVGFGDQFSATKKHKEVKSQQSPEQSLKYNHALRASTRLSTRLLKVYETIDKHTGVTGVTQRAGEPKKSQYDSPPPPDRQSPQFGLDRLEATRGKFSQRLDEIEKQQQYFDAAGRGKTAQRKVPVLSPARSLRDRTLKPGELLAQTADPEFDNVSHGRIQDRIAASEANRRSIMQGLQARAKATNSAILVDRAKSRAFRVCASTWSADDATFHQWTIRKDVVSVPS